MFNTKLPLYGLFIIIAIISGMIVVYKNTKNLDFKIEEQIGLLAYIGLGIIFGAKYFTFLTNPQKYNKTFDFTKIGLSSYGAIIGIIILLLLYSKHYKKEFKELCYIISPSMPLMYGIGKIGCFLSGCCYGIEYDGPLNISYKYSLSAPKDINLFPIQLLESIIFIIIFLYISYKIKIKKSNNNVIGQTSIICGIGKFLLDYLRMSHLGKILTINQIVSIIFILIGFYILLADNKDKIIKIK